MDSFYLKPIYGLVCQGVKQYGIIPYKQIKKNLACDGKRTL